MDGEATAGGRRSLARGTAAAGIGFAVMGSTSYAYLVVTARALGPVRYSSLSALWALVFLAGPGCFIPLEQELARGLSVRLVRREGGRPLVRRAVAAGGVMTVVLVVAGGALWPTMSARLFDGQPWLLIALEVSFVGYFAEYVLRGILAGGHRFGSYGTVVGAEGLLRVAAAVAFALAGVHAVGAYGLLLGLSPLVAAAAVGTAARPLTDEGPPASRQDVSSALWWLVAGSILGQLLVNAAPIVVKALATRAQQAMAGQFLAGLVVARAPVFLFQAVQAALLPHLAAMAAAGRHRDLRRTITALVAALIGFGVLAGAGAAVAGPAVVRLLFGRAFALRATDLALLAGGSVAFIIATALAQALIAIGRLPSVAVGWLAGVLSFAIVAALVGGLLLRVELAFMGGSVVAASVMAACLLSGLTTDNPKALQVTAPAGLVQWA